MKCSVRTCQKTLSVDHDCHVRVRLDNDEIAALPFDITSTSGVAVFHESCWKALLKQRKLKQLLQEADELAEIFDSRQRIQESVDRVAELLESSKHVVVFTGAGISTSAGIGDFRGLFGKWTEDAKFQTTNEDHPTDDVPYDELLPTLAHEAVAWLVATAKVQHVITQNCDGLHRLSGIKTDNLSELHGNVFMEYCPKCGREYERNFDVENIAANAYFEELEECGKAKRRKHKHIQQCKHCKLTHQTERSCNDCGVSLSDTIINFGDFLRDSQIQTATTHSNQADLMLVLGSTVAVTPAADLCDNQNLVICNRQRTGKDDDAVIRVFGDCDVFMDLLLKRLMGEEQYEVWKQARGGRVKQYRQERATTE